MRFLKKIKKAFSSSKKQHNARNFVEILKTSDLKLIQDTKNQLEKYKIPVYSIDYLDSKKEYSGKVILRIPEKYLSKANNILKK